MLKYTTGELAKICNVTVRTIQFYDAKNILKPSELTEGGRRLYSDEDASKLNLICMLKMFGLNLESIKEILESKSQKKILTILLDEKLNKIELELNHIKEQKYTIEIVKKSLENRKLIPVKSISDIENIMKNNKKLKNTYKVMILIAIFAGILEISTIVLWITLGIWWPFASGMILVILLAFLIVKMYYKNTSYICTKCDEKFKPNFREFMFARHTRKTRNLTCLKCGNKGFCFETYSD